MTFTVIKWHLPLIQEKLILNLQIMLKNITLKCQNLKKEFIQEWEIPFKQTAKRI